MFDIKKINSLNKSEFLSIFGNVFEKSKWISEKAFDLKPFKSLESFISEIIGIYENSDDKITLTIKDFNNYVSKDKRVEKIIVPLGDGMTVCRKL